MSVSVVVYDRARTAGMGQTHSQTMNCGFWPFLPEERVDDDEIKHNSNSRS